MLTVFVKTTERLVGTPHTPLTREQAPAASSGPRRSLAYDSRGIRNPVNISGRCGV